jgi:hypothetical protein
METIRPLFRPLTPARSIRRLVDRLLPGLHQSPRKTISLIAGTAMEVKRAVLSEWARELPVPTKFKHRLRRLWRFFARSRFEVTPLCSTITYWLVAALNGRAWIEVIMDWTKVKQHSILSLSIPYRKRGIPVLWHATDFTDEPSMNQIERRCIVEFLRSMPAELRTRIVFVGDRGFGKTSLFVFLKKRGVRFVIRVQGKVWIETPRYRGSIRRLPRGAGGMRFLTGVRYQRTERICVNMVLKHETSDPVYLVTNLPADAQVLERYRQRMTIEEGFRDFKAEMHVKDLRVRHVRSVEKVFLVHVIVYIAAMLVGSTFEEKREWVELFSIVRVNKDQCKLLSTFRMGWYVLRKLPLSQFNDILRNGYLE